MLKRYLIDFFHYNNWANQQIINAIHSLPQKDEAVRLFSHLINSQNKWLNRIMKEVDDKTLSWSDPSYPLSELRAKWEASVNKWIDFLTALDESDLEREIVYESSDGGAFSSTIREITLQPNYHNVHHRGQIVKLVRSQGIVPPATDFILMTRKAFSSERSEESQT